MIVTFRDQTNILVRVNLEGIIEIPISEEDSLAQSKTMSDELNQPRSLKDYMYPTRTSQPSCIILPATADKFELKASTIHMLPVFRGVDAENPYHHVGDFKDICGILKFNQMTEETLKLCMFPFSLKEKAKSWLYALRPQSIRTWEELTKEFFKKFFPNHKTATIRQSINSYVQLDGETLSKYLERFIDLLLQCPHHGFEQWRLSTILYEGLDFATRTLVESMCNGEYTDKSADESWAFMHEVSEKTQQWETIREPRKTANRTGVHKIESDFEMRKSHL